MRTATKLTFSDATATMLQENVQNTMKLPSVNVNVMENNTFKVDIFADIPQNAHSTQNWEGELITKINEFSICYIETGSIKIDGVGKGLSSRIFAIEYELSENSGRHNRFHISFNYHIVEGNSVDAITVYCVDSGMLTYPPETERGTVGTIGSPD